jgi:hypothetical protein
MAITFLLVLLPICFPQVLSASRFRSLATIAHSWLLYVSASACSYFVTTIRVLFCFIRLMIYMRFDTPTDFVKDSSG